uniref:Uncharacterized protein n=1 Tax=Anguilla anguilla TaxID=7936 RepID=A0A0E9XF26_ANGAN
MAHGVFSCTRPTFPLEMPLIRLFLMQLLCFIPFVVIL